MPKVGMEPIRRDALVKAAIHEVGRAGTLDVTVSQIARAAGVSSALAHHYFGAKDQIFEAAMRHILRLYGAEVRQALAGTQGPKARLEAIVRASFAASNFTPHVISAWLLFYVRAQTRPEAHRLLVIYHRRLRSNLMVGLRPLLGARSAAVAEMLAAQIDGVYIRAALGAGTRDGGQAAARVMTMLDCLIGRD